MAGFETWQILVSAGVIIVAIVIGIRILIDIRNM